MDEVRTSIEKMFDSFEASKNINTSAKRLTYGTLNSSIDGLRKSSDALSSSPATKRRRDINDSSLNISSESFNSTLNNTGQWELRILKADLIEANTKVLQLKKEVDDRVHLHKTLEKMYEDRFKSMQPELDRSLAKNKEYEKRVKHMRRQSASEKDKLIKMQIEKAQQKQNYDKIVETLRVTNDDLTSTNRENTNRLRTEISSLSVRLEEANSQLRAMQDELSSLHARNEELSERVKETDSITNDLDVVRYQLASAQRRIQELETEVTNFGEWKSMSKAFQARLAKITDLERECERLTRDNKNLHETIGNKLLLEEQVHSLKQRLEATKQSSDSHIELETKIRSLEQENSDWKRTTKEVCGSKSAVTPTMLRNYIDDIQKKHLILACDTNATNLEKSSVNDQIFELTKQNEIHVKNIEKFRATLVSYKNGLHTLRKKVSLVANERDSYKNILEAYEKDLTLTAPNMDMHPDSELKARLDIVERSLAGYKELCETLEKELQVARCENAASIGVPTMNEQNEHLQKELNTLRMENERLQRRKDELELRLERATAKEAFNIGRDGRELKIVHMAMNPADEAYDNYKIEVDKLRAEIERLKRKIRKMEDDHQDLTNRLNETTTTTANTTINIQEINALRSQVQSLENKQQHYKEIYRAASLEFREVIYLLFGYRVDRIGNNNYRISSVYAENEDEYLNFRLNEMGELDMLETDYSLTLEEMVTNYLAKHHSMPAFLSSLTLELFNGATVTV